MPRKRNKFLAQPSFNSQPTHCHLAMDFWYEFFAGNGTDPDCPPSNHDPPLHWYNVAIASLFILIDGAISVWLGLRLEKSLFIAAIRCVVQLTIMGYILEDVFRVRNPALVILMVCVLILLGTYETVYNKSKKTYNGMFLSVLVSMGTSTMIVGVLGSRFAMAQDPFWEPVKFIPSMGMLLGNCMSGMAVGISTVLTQLSDNKDKIEMSLSYGATRWEAGRPVMIEAVRLALLPTINQMSVIGLIAIPGMMTGQIIGGVPVLEAVKYQQIIMFMISASTALGVVTAVVVCLLTLIDVNHRLRPERIYNGRPHLFHDIQIGLHELWTGLKYFICCGRFARKEKAPEERSLLQ